MGNLDRTYRMCCAPAHVPAYAPHRFLDLTGDADSFLRYSPVQQAAPARHDRTFNVPTFQTPISVTEWTQLPTFAPVPVLTTTEQTATATATAAASGADARSPYDTQYIPHASLRCPKGRKALTRKSDGQAMTCNPMRPKCPILSYCYATGAVDEGTYYCCPSH
jgi:hypothetical protein